MIRDDTGGRLIKASCESWAPFGVGVEIIPCHHPPLTHGASSIQCHYYGRVGGVRSLSHATIYMCIVSALGPT
jgi:hypothetical protein